MKTIRVVTWLACLLASSCSIGAPVPSIAGDASTPLLYTSGVGANGYIDVQVYDANKPQSGPIKTLHGLTAIATGMTVDQSGDLYVSQADPNQPAVIYKPGETKPSMTLIDPLEDGKQNTDPVSPSNNIAVGADGTIYVDMCCAKGVGFTSAQSGIFVYKKGRTKPSAFVTYNSLFGSAKIPFASCPFDAGLAVDEKGDVYVGCNGILTGQVAEGISGLPWSFPLGRVLEFPAGSTTPVDTGVRVAAEWPGCASECNPEFGQDIDFSGGISDLQFDAKGNLVVLATTGSGANAIFVYPPDTPRPSRVIPLDAYSPTVDSQRSRIGFDSMTTHIFVNLISANGKLTNEIDEYTYPGGKHIATFGKGMLGIVQTFTLSPPPPLP